MKSEMVAYTISLFPFQSFLKRNRLWNVLCKTAYNYKKNM